MKYIKRNEEGLICEIFMFSNDGTTEEIEETDPEYIACVEKTGEYSEENVLFKNTKKEFPNELDYSLKRAIAFRELEESPEHKCKIKEGIIEILLEMSSGFGGNEKIQAFKDYIEPLRNQIKADNPKPEE